MYGNLRTHRVREVDIHPDPVTGRYGLKLRADNPGFLKSVEEGGPADKVRREEACV